MVKRELLTISQRAYFYDIPEYMDQRVIVRYYRISDEELNIIFEAKELEQDPFDFLQSTVLWGLFIQSVEQAEFDYLELLDNHYGHIRKFAPGLLETYGI